MTRPAVKWVGGKQRLVPKLMRRLPEDVDRLRHVELFAGSGALYFARRPLQSNQLQLSGILNDKNLRLMDTYAVLREDVDGVIRSLCGLARYHSRDHYLNVRKRFNSGSGRLALRAAMFLYLNRTCYNGLYRQNGSGQFNVPWGRYDAPRICDPKRLRSCSRELDTTFLVWSDFERAYRSVVSCDKGRCFIYLDPPHAPADGTSFQTYLAGGFSHDDHVRLRNLVREMDGAGHRVMISNADTLFVRDIYREFRVERIEGTRSVSCKGSSRGKVGELLIRNYGGGKS